MKHLRRLASLGNKEAVEQLAALETYVDEVVYRVWVMASAGRQIGMAPNPLSASDIMAVMDVYAVPEKRRLFCFETIRQLDAEWLKANSADKG